MPGFNPDNINIHDLTIEEPEKEGELPFDVEKEITQEDWEKMEKMLNEDKKAKYWMGISYEASSMKILDPNIELDIDRPLLDNYGGTILDSMKKEPQRFKGDKNYRDFLESIMNLKIIDPTYAPDLTDADWQDGKDRLGLLQREKNWRELSALAMEMKIVFPNRVKELNLNEDVWREMKNHLEHLRGQYDWGNFSSHAMRMKVLDPHIDFDLSENDWHEMKEWLKLLRDKREMFIFLRQAAAMKILAAEEVKVTDEGLEVNMKKPDLTSDTPEVPEQRKF